MARNAKIDHDANGPFTRVYHGEFAEQTEKIYAVEAALQNGKKEWWDTSPVPHTPERLEATIRLIYRMRKGATVTPVSRIVSISASPWLAVD